LYFTQVQLLWIFDGIVPFVFKYSNHIEICWPVFSVIYDAPLKKALKGIIFGKAVKLKVDFS